MSWLSRSAVVVVAVAALLVVPSVLAQTFTREEDASGNGRHLTEVGPITEVRNSWKFGDGVAFQNDTARMEREDSTFALTGDMSLAAAFNATNVKGVDRLVSSVEVGASSSSGLFFALDAVETPSGVDVRFVYEGGGAGPEICSQEINENETVGVWVTRNVRSLLADQVSVKVFQTNGAMLQEDCEFSGDPVADPGNFDHFRVGKEGALTESNSTVYEVRLWDEVVDESTLDQIADPTDAAFTLSAEGSEFALYFLEPIDPPGDADLDNTVGIYGEPEVAPGEAYTLNAEGHNQSGFPIDPQENLTAFITKTSGATTSWLNTSSSALQSFVVSNEMAPVSGSVNDTLFTLSIPGGFPEEGSYRVEVWMEKDVPGEPGANNKWVGTYDVKVAEASATTTASHETDLTTFTKLTALEMAWFVGVAVAGVVLWSKSHDPAVRAFGSALPMFAGALLLAFGAEEGLGSVWAGTVPLAATLFLVGVAMLVRLAYEWVQDDDLISREGFM